ncbi:MAG: U32 family peptidase [Bacteriovoracaceae bacterium]|nr:U32 family peptidase [Bacteriovoracaceae bacterium]
MKPELLLPVGDMSMCLAAIHNGADAIYVGMPGFNARGRTHDHTVAELKEMIDLCHLYGVRVNLAFNVVLFQDELEQAIQLLKEVLPLRPDAFIVQDLGLAKIIRAISPSQRIHGSTQMTVTNFEAINFLDDLKIDRFVLGRENSLDEIQLIRENTQKELEVFVHGALCVAYSGQCFTSEAIGGRSANRGQCAQSCRLEYEMYVDGEKKEVKNQKYLVSPKDLFGLEKVPALKKIGINSYKVEGRLKGPEYVALTARHYAQALNFEKINPNAHYELSQGYSRGFFTGWLDGVNHQALVDGTYSSHRGVKAGKILKIEKNQITLQSDYPLKAGQGLLFIAKKEIGDKIFKAQMIKQDTYQISLLSHKGADLSVGQIFYINSDEQLQNTVAKSWSDRTQAKKIPLRIQLQGEVGQRLKLIAKDIDNNEVVCLSEAFLQPAKTSKLSKEVALEELNALSSSVYTITECDVMIKGDVFLHHKELKKIKKEMIENLNALRTKPNTEKVNEYSLASKTLKSFVDMPQLNLVLRSKEQVEAFVAELENFNLKHLGVVILDFEFGKDYSASLTALRTQKIKTGIATTRILKPKEYYNLRTIERLAPDFILARNLGAAHYFLGQNFEVWGDFSLNVTNSESYQYLKAKGLKVINASYDLNKNQLLGLANQISESGLEVTLHHYMPEFHMEHCVFAATLSNGTSFKDCGKPCEKHTVELKDSYGINHFLKADHECRNTFYKSTPQSAAFLLEELKQLGVQHYRLELLNETAAELSVKIKTYLAFFAQELSLSDAMNQLGLTEKYGLSSGQLNDVKIYKDRKKVIATLNA